MPAHTIRTLTIATIAYTAGIASFLYAAHLWLDKHLMTPTRR